MKAEGRRFEKVVEYENEPNVMEIIFFCAYLIGFILFVTNIIVKYNNDSTLVPTIIWLIMFFLMFGLTGLFCDLLINGFGSGRKVYWREIK